nr:retrovirus-related Pol polyprotein from transposon TNT 1-94 [Tanacetum cinerariifolium]
MAELWFIMLRGNKIKAEDCDAFDSNVDEASTAQSMFIANLSSVDPVTDEAVPSYDSDILSEYVKDNAVPVIHSNVSSVPNDAFMMIYNDMYEPHAQSVSNTSRNTVVENSLTAELTTYKEEVELYKKRAKFELTEREQKINEQLRLVISDRNFKEETLKKELHSIKSQIASIINHNKSIVEEVMFLKKDFKQKENKYLEDFLDMKSLKEKPALYNGHEIIKNNHVSAIVHNTEDTLEIAEITRKKINDKMKDPECVTRKLKYQNLKDSFGNNPPTPDKDTPDFDSVFVIEKMQASLQGKDNVIRQLKKQISQLQETHSDTDRTLKNMRLALVRKTLNNERNNLLTFLSLGKRVNSCPNASGSQPRSNTKKNKISPAKGVNKLPVEEQSRTNKSLLRTSNCVDSSSRIKRTVVQIVLWYLDSGCSKLMLGDRSRLMNFMKKFIGTVRFENGHFGAIMGYGDYVNGDSVISRVYYVEGLGHNLFFVGQFCDYDLEVAFRKHSCYVRDTGGVELIKGSRGFNLYTISIKDMMKSSPICLLSKASKNKSWLWHRRLKHLNFGTINDFARKDLVRGLARLKFKKDHLCSACQLGKSKKNTHKPKTKNTNLEVLNTLHMDLCGLMRVQTFNGKKYILVIIDDYSRFTWVKFLRSKDETPEVVIKFVQQIQVSLNKTVRYIRTDNGTEFVNQTLTDNYERIRIFHQKTVPRTPQQNDVVERRNRALVEAARTIKTPYELVHTKKPDHTFFRVFGALCYPTNDSEDLGKLQPTADIRIFVGYAPSRKGYRIYNKRTQRIMETIHVQFDELTEPIALVHISTGPTPNFLMPGQICSGIVPNPVLATPYVPPMNKDLEILFQPVFDEYLEPPRIDRPVSPAQAVQALVNSAGTPSSTTIDQDAPSSSISPSSSALQSHQGIAAESTFMGNNPVAPVDNNPFINVFAPEPSSDASSSGDWIYKVKLDEYGDVLKNKAWLVAKGYRQEEASRPDFVFAVYMCAKYQASPTKKHLEALKWVFRYLKGTINWGLRYPKDTSMALTAYADADHAGCQDTRRSTSGSAQFLGDKLITALTSTRFPYIVTIVVQLLSAARMSSTPDYQLVDIFTKALPRQRFEFLLPRLDTMVDVNVNAPAGQAPTMVLPMRTDDQILPHIRWMPIGNINCYLDVEKPQSNPIYKIAWFNLTKDTLKDALLITPVNNNQAFTSPPSFDALINFVNGLGYLKLVRNLSNVVINDMFQPLRAVTTIINLCLIVKTSGFERPRAPMLQILWGVVTRAHIDFTERIWEEFTQSIHTFIEDKRNLAQHTYEKKGHSYCDPEYLVTKLIIYHLQRKHKFHPRPDSLLHLPNEEPVLGYLKFSAKGTKREVFGMPIPGSLITADIQGASYYQEYLAKVAKHQRYLAGETGSNPDSPALKPTKTAMKPKPTTPKADPRPPISKPVSSKQPEPKSAPAKTQGKKRKLTTEITNKPSKAIKSRLGFVFKKRKPISTLRALEESLKSMYDVPRGSLPLVVIREPESEKYQPLPEVSGKGKEKVIKEQVARDLLTLQTHKKKSLADRYIFQRRTSTLTRSSGHDESSSLYAEFGLTDSKEESEEDVLGADAGGQGKCQAGPDPGAQDEGQARSNPDEQAKGQARPDPGNTDASQPMPSPVVHAGSDREHMDLDVADVSTQPPPEQMDKGDKPSESDNDKTTAETKAESMVYVTIQQDMSSIPPMTSLIINLTSRPKSPKRNGKLKHIMADLIQEKKRLEQRLDSHGARMYTLEQLDLPHQVSKAVDEVVTDAVDWAMQAPLQNRFRDLPEADMKEIFHQRIRESPKMPPGSPPHQPPPPPPAGPSGALGSLQVPPPPPPPPSTNQKEERPPTSEPAWSIPSSDVPVLTNNWASALASNYSPPPEDSLLAQIGDIAMFMDWFCKRRGITELKPQDLEGSAFEIIKVFHPNVIHLQYQMEECHKLLTDSVDDSILRHNVSKPLPLGGPPEQMVPDQIWIEEECQYDIVAMHGISHWWFQRQRFYIDRHTSEGDHRAVRTHMRILSVVKIEVFSMYGYNYMKKIVLRRANLNEHVIVERDFKLMKNWTTRLKEFKINRMNPGLNTRFWTRKDVDRSKAFMFSIQKRLKTRRIFRNLQSFVGGRVSDEDYRLLKRTE